LGSVRLFVNGGPARADLQFGSELVSRHEEGAAMYGRAGLSIGRQTAHLTNP